MGVNGPCPNCEEPDVSEYAIKDCPHYDKPMHDAKKFRFEAIDGCVAEMRVYQPVNYETVEDDYGRTEEKEKGFVGNRSKFYKCPNCGRWSSSKINDALKPVDADPDTLVKKSYSSYDEVKLEKKDS